MKFSLKLLFFIAVITVAVFVNVSPMKVEADVSKFFGGAQSADELQARVDANFDQHVTERSTTCWFEDLFCTTKSLQKLVAAGPVDVQLREVAASQAETQKAVVALSANKAISEAAKSAALKELEIRQKFLSEVGKCYTALRDDLGQAKETVAINAGEIDRISKINDGSLVVDRDVKIAKTVNDAMSAPFERAQTCFDHVVTGDALAAAQVSLGTELVDGKTDPYIESNKHLNKVSEQLAKKAGQARAELERQELVAKCAVSGTSSLDCRLNDAQIKAYSAGKWVGDGWTVLGDNLARGIESVKAVDWSGHLEAVNGYGLGQRVCASDLHPETNVCLVGEYETCSAQPFQIGDMSTTPYSDYAVQGGKMVGGAALAAVGIYAAWKLGKLSWRGACALKNALWTNRSKLSRAAIVSLGTLAVAVAPSLAVQYGYMN